MVGIFDDRAQAEQAIDELLRAGFSNNQIRHSGQGAATGGVLASLKSFLETGEPLEATRYWPKG